MSNRQVWTEARGGCGQTRIIGWSLLTCAQKKVKLHHASSVQFGAWDARMALLSAHVRGTAEFLVRHKDKSRRTDGRCWRFLSCDGQLMFAGQRRDVTDVLVLATARPQSHPQWRTGRHVAKRLACWFSLLAFFLSLQSFGNTVVNQDWRSRFKLIFTFHSGCSSWGGVN